MLESVKTHSHDGVVRIHSHPPLSPGINYITQNN